ncbi:hypothetical protein J4Q44_G00261700 [Coregonus suidteri]|uniref:AXH domain-containing protein n=1 Tax=Coregonus suidteri TaxID=861788 RepID=A0AAN8LHE7_9TELE
MARPTSAPPLDEFKPPATPPRTWPASSSGRGEGGRESEPPQTNRHSLLPSIPPPLPSPGIPFPLPWHLAYPSSAPLPHHSRWLHGEIPLTLPPPSSSSSSFKSPFPADSRDMWSNFNTGRRDYSSSLYLPDLSLTEGRHRYPGKRPNGLDGLGSRTASASRVAPPSGEYGNEPSGSARLGGSPHGSHANGRRRHQEVSTVRSQPFRDFQVPPPEGPDSHSSLQDRDPRGTPKAGTPTLIPTSPQPYGAEIRAGRGELLDPLGGSVAEAHIYYSLRSVYSTLQPSHLSPQAQAQRYPLYSPSGSSLYGLNTMRDSQHSTQGQSNSHSTERDRQQEQEREREHEGDRDIRQRDSKRDRDKDSRELSPGQQYSRPLASPLLPHMTASPPAPHHIPPALLPHFAKGSLIELVGGRLKRVEELRTEDFLRSADTSPEFHLSTCTVLLIAPSNTHGFNHLQVLLTDRNTQELLTVLVEYPFFVHPLTQEQPRPRKRRWSAPDLLPSTGTTGIDKTTDLPHGSKQRKRQ